VQAHAVSGIVRCCTFEYESSAKNSSPCSQCEILSLSLLQQMMRMCLTSTSHAGNLDTFLKAEPSIKEPYLCSPLYAKSDAMHKKPFVCPKSFSTCHGLPKSWTAPCNEAATCICRTTTSGMHTQQDRSGHLLMSWQSLCLLCSLLLT
jgi:hypothetical protein